MKRAAHVDDFVRDPVGRFHLGTTHLIWCHSPSLCGSTHWGRPSEVEARELVRLLEFSRHEALGGGFDVFMDNRALEVFAWPAFGILTSYVKSRIDEWSRRIRRHAVLVPPGVVGALVAGLVPLVGMTYPIRFFSSESVSEASAWLDRPELAAVLQEVAGLVDEASGVAPLLRALRDQLDHSLTDATVESAAHALGLSPRSLQRELRRHRTQFSVELTSARVRAACLLLVHSEERVETIARRVGCASSSQLSVIFRRLLAETPAAYRARMRG